MDASTNTARTCSTGLTGSCPNGYTCRYDSLTQNSYCCGATNAGVCLATQKAFMDARTQVEISNAKVKQIGSPLLPPLRLRLVPRPIHVPTGSEPGQVLLLRPVERHGLLPRRLRHVLRGDELASALLRQPVLADKHLSVGFHVPNDEPGFEYGLLLHGATRLSDRCDAAELGDG